MATVSRRSGNRSAGRYRKMVKSGFMAGGKEKDMENEKYTKKKQRKIWKIFLLAGVILCLIFAGAAGGFFYLRTQGEKNLKTEVPAAASEVQEDVNKGETGAADQEEGLYITYQGKKYRYNSDVINILCMGIDKDIPIEEKRDTGSEGLSDAIMLASINTQENTVKFLAVPRDTVVPVKVLNTAGEFVRTENKQITLQYAYGRTAEDSCELMVQAVSNLLYQVPIQRYCSINFQAVPVLNDAIGGVDLTAIETVQWWNGSFYQGQQMHLMGQEALDYVRQRDETIPGSSMGRIERQKQYITCYIDQAKEAVKKDITLPVKLFQSLTEDMCTDLEVEDVTYLASELLEVSVSAEDMSMVPGDVLPAGEHEEYHVQTDALKELVIQSFYEEVPETPQGQEQASVSEER